MKRKPANRAKNAPRKAAEILFYSAAVLWLGIALLTFGDMTLSGNTLAVRLMASGFLLLHAALLIVGARILPRKTKWTWLALLAVVLFNAAIAFAIPYKTLGSLALVLDAALLIALTTMRKTYFAEKA